MSDSRLEKFIYAICSMDVSDLPAPLSRIEKLWNCLITGDAPDFEPLSRNEKYLMAMLDRYDISNLPAPMSRGEKLLYKIAVGETDLSDVPDYLSRYEELLKYLIENGVLSDFEYVLYTLNQSLSTLYQTVEKPVKSAILKGQTLVNLFDFKEPITVMTDRIRLFSSDSFKNRMSNGVHTIVNSSDKKISLDICNKSGDAWVKTVTLLGNQKTTVEFADTYIRFVSFVFSDGWSNSLEDEIKNTVVVLEGDYANCNIPYFTGMQSVKMPVLKTVGKNLLDMSSFVDTGNHNNILTTFPSNWGRAYKLQLKPNTTYTVSRSATTTRLSNNMCVFNGDESQRKGLQTSIQQNVTTNDDGILYFSLAGTSSDKEVSSSAMTKFIEEVEYLQVEEGVVATPYEPYKSNILTVNEPVELRGIGDAQDTLDLMTGEYVQHISEVVLDGSDNGITYKTYSTNNDGYSVFQCPIPSSIYGKRKYNGKWMSTFPMGSSSASDWNDREYVGGNWYGATNMSHVYVIKLLTSSMSSNDVNGFKEYLQQNPITIQYELVTPTVKTVDLTTVDQDGQPTKLKTFNDITHVEINADNLIPSVDVEVATKISETLSTMGPKQLDISNTQNELGQTIEEQSENTDATMMATTEIYEQIL